jgi:hypothetical protein
MSGSFIFTICASLEHIGELEFLSKRHFSAYVFRDFGSP